MAKKKTKKKAKPRLTMLGTMRINLTPRVAEVQDAAGNSVFVLPRTVLRLLDAGSCLADDGVEYRCNWFSGSGHLCFLSSDEWERVNTRAIESYVDIIPFDGHWDLTDDPESAELDVCEWAEACCKIKHPRGKRKLP